MSAPKKKEIRMNPTKDIYDKIAILAKQNKRSIPKQTEFILHLVLCKKTVI